MKYNIKYNKKTGICLVEVSGNVRRPEDSMKLQKVALEHRIKQGYSRFLFDMRRAKIISSTLKTFETGIAAQTQGLKQYDYNTEIQVFINRGYNVHVTNNIEEAIEWLSPKS